jgi:hypothetical protein
MPSKNEEKGEKERNSYVGMECMNAGFLKNNADHSHSKRSLE